jgi:predicted porin
MALQKHLAAGLAAAGLAAAASPAFAQVQIYGRINTAVEYVKASTDTAGASLGSVSRLSNYRSVLGYRGDEDLGGGLRAIWQIEGGFSLDTGSGGIATRDTRVGLVTPYGTIFGGNWTLPYTSATSGLDPFYPTTAGYMAIMGNGSAPTSNNVIDTTSFDRRQQNSLHYWTPDWNGFSARAAYAFSEEKTATKSPSLISLAAIYDKDDWYLTLAHEEHKSYQGAGLTDRGTKVGVAYRFGNTRLAGIAENLRYETTSGSLERNAFYLSATHQMGPHGFRFGVAHALNGKGSSTEQLGPLRSGSETGATQYTLGYDYSFSKRTTLFTYVSRIDNKRNATYDFAINELGIGSGSDLSMLALGIRHSF